MSVAFVTMAALGYDTSAYSLPYLASWANGDAKVAVAAVTESGTEIQRAAKALIEVAQAQAEDVAA